MSEAQLPRAPRTIHETGLARDKLADLCTKTLFRHGRSTLNQLSHLMRLPRSVITDLLTFIRAERLIELVGHRGVEADADYQLSDMGRDFAREANARSSYIGPTPVTIEAYCQMVNSHSMRHQTIDAVYVRQAFSQMVIAPEIVDQMGAAVNSGRPILIYGPAGSGKTFLAKNLASLHPGLVPVPYAITVGGEIIQMFDPLVHEVVAAAPDSNSILRTDHDERWQMCRRPVVISGGELTLAMLDLQFDETTRFYQAPPHLKANGGVFVIDDLGRQLVSPRDLMNRWIVPLEYNHDYLSLHTGFKFSVPFDMSVIFSTNLKPHELADEAFLRRFGYKVFLGPVDETSYRRMFEQNCQNSAVMFDADGFEWLLQRHREESRDLLACYPRDLVARVRDFAVYEGKPARATAAELERGWTTYFTISGA